MQVTQVFITKEITAVARFPRSLSEYTLHITLLDDGRAMVKWPTAIQKYVVQDLYKLLPDVLEIVRGYSVTNFYDITFLDEYGLHEVREYLPEFDKYFEENK